MIKLRKTILALKMIGLMFVLLTAHPWVSAPSKAQWGGWDWGVEFRTWYFADPERTIFVGYYVYNTCTGVEVGDGEHTAYYEQIYDDIYCGGIPNSSPRFDTQSSFGGYRTFALELKQKALPCPALAPDSAGLSGNPLMNLIDDDLEVNWTNN